MAKFRLKSKITGKYIEITQEAIETPVEDIRGFYEGKDVETILTEIGMKIKNGVATPDDIALVKTMLDELNDEILDLRNDMGRIDGVDTEVLKSLIKDYTDGKLGSGNIEGVDTEVLKEMIVKYLRGDFEKSLTPTIESTFPETTIIEEGKSVTIDIYFQTPNLGDGTLIITINNAEIDLQPIVAQGNNNITIPSKYLNKTNNIVMLYAKDRANMTSNKLTFKVISGGVSLNTTFDHTVDYVVGQNILFPFTVTSEMEGEIILYRTIDGIEIEPMVCTSGYNSFYLNEFITGVGSHAVSMYAMVGTYKSKVLSFNVVISSSTQLTLSSSTLNGTQFTYGESVQISYRISKVGNETFEVNFYVDDKLMRTSSVATGSYIWTIAAGVLSIGTKTVKIVATGTSGDTAEVTVEIEIVKGAFTPIEIITGGMTCHLNSDGYSNEMDDKTIWVDRSGKGNNGELIGFNFSTNGWNPTINEVEPSKDGTTSTTKTVKYVGLVCNNDAYVRIPYKPFYNNVINGFTIEMLYTPEHSGNNKARVLEYVDHDTPYVGVYADIDEAFIKSESETTAGQVDLDYESGEIQLDFVIDRENKLCRVYIDGICTRYWTLSDSGTTRESFAIDQDYIYLNFSALNSEYCGGTNVIRKFICYERALTHEEIVNNWVANAPDIIEMERRYNWCYNTQIPKVQIYGDISNISSTVPAYVRIKYISTDEEKYGASFDMESANSPIYLQGTSSLGYSRKNYRFILIDNNGQEYFHEMFPGNALPESTYTCKCDYVDSSMACNVTLCKIANDTLYGRGFTIAQRDNPMRRTATYGHAIELVNIVNNEEISLGAYTIIIDRYAEKSMGYDKTEYPNILVMEGESNSDTGASSLHAYTNPESSGSQFANETDYINEGFKVVYPPTNEAAYDFADAKKLVNFVDLSAEDNFKDTFESVFNKESVLKYYLFCLCFASVDTLAKNLHFVRYTDVWYILPYDLDSVLGGSNVGFLNISSSCEVGNVYDEKDPTIIVEPNQYNSWNGRLWARIRDIFATDLTAMWTTLRSSGTFNYDNFIKYFDEIWDAIPPTMYNSSQQIKYIDYGVTGQVALHGNRKHQIKKFLRERIAYLDSKFGFYSDGGTENYANIRMNVLGDVSLTIETYYPVYYTIKWATNNIETHRIAKNTKYTFNYFSDVSTDREVLLYLPHTLKSIENLDSLQPASIDVSKATKLTKLEVHSKKLYSVNVTNNKYLRTIDFNGCKLLGTDTISTLSILYAKYLKYLDVRGTQLTAVNFSPQGGSIVDCYLPNTITSLTIRNQLLLTNLIIPSGNDTPQDLTTVTIDNCPLITKLSDIETAHPFDVFKYCRTLNVNNSFLTMNEITFDGFTRLQTVSLSNMESLTNLGLNDLCVKGETSSLRYIGISSCKNLTKLSLNCTSNNYEIAFANSSLLDLSTSNVTQLRSNCVMKGLDTIVLPVCIENMYFTNEYGSGYSDIKNIWSAATAVIDSSGVFPTAKHMNYNTNITDEYEGIDFYGLHLYNIDLGALVNIPDAINFGLYPTTVNPNFNLNRDGVKHPFLQPSGVLDLSNYTEPLTKFFNGVDLDKLYVACKNDLPQTDLSYCFYGSSFSSPARLNNILDHITTVSNMEYCFYGTSTSNIDVLSSVNFLPGTSLRYCFAGCPNITELSDVALSSNIGDASYMFSGSGLRSINNVSTSCGTIVGMFSNCDNLVEVNNFTASATTSYESLFEGCGGMTVAPIVEIPSTIVNISKMYKGCNSLVSIDGMVLHGNITDATEFIADCNNLINANNVTIAGSFYNDIFRGITSIKYVNNLLISYVGRSMSFAHMFDGCSNLVEMSFHNDSYVKDVISMDYMFAGTRMRTLDFSNVNFEKVTSLKYMFANGLMEEFSYTVPITIISIQGFLSGCSNLKTLRNFIVPTNVSTLNWLDDTNVENLIDCSFNTQYTKFTDKTSIKVVENLEYTGTDFSNYFNGCTSLERVSLALTNTTTKAESAFANCPNLIQIDFADSDLSNVTSINGMFNSDTSLTTINNLKIVKNTTTANNTTLAGCPISNTDGLYINSNNALNMFRLGAESAITAVTDFGLGKNANDLSELFMNNPNITHDITIPSHVYSVEKMYYNCIKLTHVTSNWSNIYDLNIDTNPNNDVVTANCYGACTNIKYIDNEVYMNEYGELTAIYSIPEEWGGILKCTADQTAFYINSDLLTEYTITLNGTDGTYTTEWGDGTTDKRTTHTYTRSGSFRIVTNNNETFGTGSRMPDNFRTAITRVLHLNENITNGSHLFDGCTKLLEIQPLKNTFNAIDYMFNNCNNLLDVDMRNVSFGDYASASYMCNGCTKFTKIPISMIPDTCTDISYLFANTRITDISGLTFGSKISNVTSWMPPNLTTANNVIIKNNYVKFNGCKTLINCDNFIFTGTLMNEMFNNCVKLQSVKNIKTNNRVTNYTSLFGNCGSLSEIDFINIDFTSATAINYMVQGLKAGAVIKNIKFGSNITTSGMDGWMNGGFKNIENIYISTNTVALNFNGKSDLSKTLNNITGVTFSTNVTDITGMLSGANKITEDFVIPSHITNCTNCFKGCTSMTHVHSNWKKTYTNGITPTDCYAGCTEITHIDGVDIGKSAYVNGLDGIPPAWGGYGMYPAYTTIAEFEIPENNFALQITNSKKTYLFDDGIIDWGDGTVTRMEITHTYAKAGTYVVKGKYWFWNPNLTWRNNITKLIKGTQQPVSAFYLFAAGEKSKMTYADFSDMTLTQVNGMCGGHQKSKNFETIIFKNTTITTGNLDSFIKNCQIENLDLSGIKFTEKITTLAVAFGNCSKLKKIDLSMLDLSYLTTIKSCFSDCTALEEIVLPETHLVTCAEGGNAKMDIQSAFQGAISLKKIDLSMIYGQVGVLYRWATGASSVEEFYVQNLTTTTPHLGYSLTGSREKLTEFRYFKSITWANLGTVNIFQNFTLALFPAISKESLLSFLNALPDISSLTTEAYTFPIGATNMAKLTEDEILAVTNKGYSMTV